ncbi:hypothetical protein VOLCADRAFT_119460, partial [Volvox carteri f. nagariensis]
MPAVGRSATKPKSLVEHLSEQAPKRPVNEIVSLDRYLMSAQLLLKQAADYRLIGDEEQLYVMLLRFASLVVETIPTHRDFRDGNATYRGLKKDLLVSFLPELERLKASLRLKDRPEPPAAASRNRPADAVQLSVSALPQLDWASSGAPTPPPPAAAAADVNLDGQVPFKVDDLLEVLGTTVPMAPPVPAAAAAAAAAVAPPPADPYALAAEAAASLAALSTGGLGDIPQPKYALSYAASTNSTRHALFGATSQPQLHQQQQQQQLQLQRGSSGDAGAMPRYPVLDRGPSASSSAWPAPVAGEVTHLSLTPAVMEQQQQQMALAMAAVPHPSAGPSLGPQEVS